jgi:thymidylate kinase
MITVLEGVDCVGKTTFANELSKRTGYEIVKGSSFEIANLGQDGMYEHMMSLLDRDNIIIDRFFYSNLVYGYLYEYPMMKIEQYAMLRRKLNKKALVVYLHTTPYVIKERMVNRGDDMIKTDEVDSIIEMYESTMYGAFAPKSMLSLETSVSDFSIATAMVNEIINLDTTKIYIKAT